MTLREFNAVTDLYLHEAYWAAADRIGDLSAWWLLAVVAIVIAAYMPWGEQ